MKIVLMSNYNNNNSIYNNNKELLDLYLRLDTFYLIIKNIEATNTYLKSNMKSLQLIIIIFIKIYLSKKKVYFYTRTSIEKNSMLNQDLLYFI